MKPVKTATLLTTIINLARSQGELRHREFLIQEQLKGLDASDNEDSVFLKRRPTRIAESRRAEHRLALQEHRQRLAHMKFLAQEELCQVQRLSFEIEEEMGETVSSLKKRLE